MDLLKIYIQAVRNKRGAVLSKENQNKFISMVEPKEIEVECKSGEKITIPVNFLQNDNIKQILSFLRTINLSEDEIQIIKGLIDGVWSEVTEDQAKICISKLAKLGLPTEVVDKCNKLIVTESGQGVMLDCVSGLVEFCIENSQAVPLMDMFNSYIISLI